jgi:hypothetical protein
MRIFLQRAKALKLSNVRPFVLYSLRHTSVAIDAASVVH